MLWFWFKRDFALLVYQLSSIVWIVFLWHDGVIGFSIVFASFDGCKMGISHLHVSAFLSEDTFGWASVWGFDVQNKRKTGTSLSLKCSHCFAPNLVATCDISGVAKFGGHSSPGLSLLCLGGASGLIAACPLLTNWFDLFLLLSILWRKLLVMVYWSAFSSSGDPGNEHALWILTRSHAAFLVSRGDFARFIYPFIWCAPIREARAEDFVLWVSFIAGWTMTFPLTWESLQGSIFPLDLSFSFLIGWPEFLSSLVFLLDGLRQSFCISNLVYDCLLGKMVVLSLVCLRMILCILLKPWSRREELFPLDLFV